MPSKMSSRSSSGMYAFARIEICSPMDSRPNPIRFERHVVLEPAVQVEPGVRPERAVHARQVPPQAGPEVRAAAGLVGDEPGEVHEKQRLAVREQRGDERGEAGGSRPRSPARRRCCSRSARGSRTGCWWRGSGGSRTSLPRNNLLRLRERRPADRGAADDGAADDGGRRRPGPPTTGPPPKVGSNVETPAGAGGGACCAYASPADPPAAVPSTARAPGGPAPGGRRRSAGTSPRGRTPRETSRTNPAVREAGAQVAPGGQGAAGGDGAAGAAGHGGTLRPGGGGRGEAAGRPTGPATGPAELAWGPAGGMPGEAASRRCEAVRDTASPGRLAWVIPVSFPRTSWGRYWTGPRRPPAAPRGGGTVRGPDGRVRLSG